MWLCRTQEILQRKGGLFPISCPRFLQRLCGAYLLWWGCSHQLTSNPSLSLRLLGLPHLSLQGLPAPPVQSPPLLLSPSLTSQTWLLYPGKKYYSEARQLQTSGNPEPLKSITMLSGLGRALCGLSVIIKNRHTEKPVCTAALQFRLKEKWWGRVEGKAPGFTRRSTCSAFSPLFSFSCGLSQSSHLM